VAISTKVSAQALIVGLAAAQAFAAYEYPLTSTSVREAYFLGSRKDEKTSAFLARYTKRLPIPKTGPHIAEIEIDTPYQQVVERARVAPPGYSSQQAEEEYRNDPNSLRVRVQIHLTPTYSSQLPNPSGGIQLRPDDFWRDFSVRVFQERELAPRAVAGRPIYSAAGSLGDSQLIGAEIKLEFAADEVASKPIRVEVLAPDGQRVVADFDLDKLR
jgi:hypothetical protein